MSTIFRKKKKEKKRKTIEMVYYNNQERIKQKVANVKINVDKKNL